MNIIETADKHTANGTFKVFLLTLTLSFFTLELSAQLEKASDNVRAWKVANCTVPFDLNYEGEPFHIRWEWTRHGTASRTSEEELPLSARTR